MSDPTPCSEMPFSKLSTELVSAALVQCQGKVRAAEFDATNPFFKSRYATLGSVIETSRAALLQTMKWKCLQSNKL